MLLGVERVSSTVHRSQKCWALTNHHAAQYWQKIADFISTEKILEMYKEMNPVFKDEIKLEDITDKNGHYKQRNKWNQRINTGTIAHLIQDNNSLSAEIDIAAQATVIRKDLAYGNIITNITQLCGDASGYGSTLRNSDPAVGDP